MAPFGAVTRISSAMVAPSRNMQCVCVAPSAAVDSDTHRLNPASAGPATAVPNWNDGSCPSEPAPTSVARTAAEIPRSVPLPRDHRRSGRGRHLHVAVASWERRGGSLRPRDRSRLRHRRPRCRRRARPDRLDAPLRDHVCEQPVGLAESMVGGGDDGIDQAHVDPGPCEQRRQLRPREVDVADEHDGDAAVLRGPEQLDGFGHRLERVGLQVEFGGEPGRRDRPSRAASGPDLVEGALRCRDLGVRLDLGAVRGSSPASSSARRASDRALPRPTFGLPASLANTAGVTCAGRSSRSARRMKRSLGVATGRVTTVSKTSDVTRSTSPARSSVSAIRYTSSPSLPRWDSPMRSYRSSASSAFGERHAGGRRRPPLDRAGPR